MTEAIRVVSLGQAGFRLAFGATVIFIDPYLSNRVQEIEGDALKRMVPIWRDPSEISDADWVLVTHAHIDHCDPATLLPIASASPNCKFMGPPSVVAALESEQMNANRIFPATEAWVGFGKDLRVCAVPAAHPTIERDESGAVQCVGYVIEYAGRRIYHSGDTSLTGVVIEAVRQLGPIDVAILPVNERNHYRDSQGIIGNMTMREAFQFAADLGVATMVPMHWDMFSPNSVYREEIDLYTRLARPPFRVVLDPERL